VYGLTRVCHPRKRCEWRERDLSPASPFPWPHQRPLWGGDDLWAQLRSGQGASGCDVRRLPVRSEVAYCDGLAIRKTLRSMSSTASGTTAGTSPSEWMSKRSSHPRKGCATQCRGDSTGGLTSLTHSLSGFITQSWMPLSGRGGSPFQPAHG